MSPDALAALVGTGSEMASDVDTAPFLDAAPPPWAARALSTVLLLLFAATIVALFAVRVPESVWATFVVRPMRGADPVRTLHDGIVDKVNVEDAQPVAADAVLFVVASEPVGDRVAEREALEAGIRRGRGGS